MKFRMMEILRAPEGGDGGAAGGGAGDGAAGGDGAGGESAGDAGQQQQAPEGYINPDGSFAEGWHQRPEFAEFKGIDRFKTVPDLVKSYRHLETLKGTPGDAVIVPGADATPEQRAAYHKAIGVPETPDAYALKPEQLPEGIEWHDGRGKAFAEFAHKQGMTQAQAAAVVAFQLEQEQATRGDAQAAYQNLLANREAELKKEWGSAYNHKLMVAKQVVSSLGFDPGDAELFGNPKVLSFIGKMSGLLSEDTVSSMRGSLPEGMKFTHPHEEARSIATNPSHPENARYLQGDEAIVAKVRRLYDQPA